MKSNKKRKLNYNFLEVLFAIAIMLIYGTKKLSRSILLIILTVSDALLHNFFNNKEKFDKDSKYLMLPYIIPISLLLLISIFGVFNTEIQKYLKDYTIYAAGTIISLLLYFLFLYFIRCLKVIKEIRGDKHLFVAETIKSALKYFLYFSAASLAIISFSDEQGYMVLTYQLSNVFVNSILLFIDMFVYVRSEIDEFDKQEKVDEEKKEKLDEQKYEMDKKELQTIKKEIEMMKNKINRKTAKIEYKIIHYKNK
ncbi:hypothetical protein [Lactobacillus sp. M0390]|uniref:hypothetical protein n=1 Tax=Lactobacillus sp. M0390 TaxID=2751026 RepID=UPI0018DC4F0B|nr:hypothetical protein [Lactobacillus sp. M0390]MBH9985224.1 hypothetical protein [Lactobacillus sp. M0390]